MVKISSVDPKGPFASKVREIHTRFTTPSELIVPGAEAIASHTKLLLAAYDQLNIPDVLPDAEESELNKLVIHTSEGQMFRVRGSFIVRPDGNNLNWGYGPPVESVELHKASGKELDFEDEEPIEEFIGPSLTLSFDEFAWKRAMEEEGIVDSPEKRLSFVKISIVGPKTTWNEQAVRYIRLPEVEGDRMGKFHKYGMPGSIPCWQAYCAEGSLPGVKIDLTEDDTPHTIHQPALLRLWVPDRVMMPLLGRYPDLIDQGGDYSTRTNAGHALRMLGVISAAFRGEESNDFDILEPDIPITTIDDPKLANMPTEGLVKEFEAAMERVDRTTNPEREAHEAAQRARVQATLAKFADRLFVVTDVVEPLDKIADKYGLNDDWLKEYGVLLELPF